MKVYVVGVIDDIHSRSMHETVDPVVIICTRNYSQ